MASSLPPERRGVLLDQIRAFGTELADLLENTVGCQRLHLEARWREAHNDGRLGYKLDRAGIPTRIRLPGPGGTPSCHLYMLFRLTINDAGYLVTTKSALRLFLDEQSDSPSLFRYEYVRDYNLDYPNPHLHVEAEVSEAWRELNRRTNQKKGLGQLHFPLGGKRYRPSVEDFLEFLIYEGYVRAVAGWEDAIEVYRSEFHKRQLSAAVKANPESAIQTLRDLGYKIKLRRR